MTVTIVKETSNVAVIGTRSSTTVQSNDGNQGGNDVNENNVSVAPRIRTFSLSASNGVVVEVSNVGASIHRILLPKTPRSKQQQENSDHHDDDHDDVDDVVLGYPTALQQYESKNPTYFNVIVGRVANRTARGIFTLKTTTKDNTIHDGNNAPNRQTFQLATNNGPNHLHGGECGFSHCIWDAQIMKPPKQNDNNNDDNDAVVFTLVSPDGDQGYPGTVQVKATYSLVPTSDTGVTLRLHMEGQLLDTNDPTNKAKATPLNLAQHSYFNLAGHDCPTGILDHTLTMPCEFYLPVDATSIPTRQVQSVAQSEAAHMDWRTPGRQVRDALVSYALAAADVTEKEVHRHFEMSRDSPSTLALSGPHCMNPNQPYGFDHNYIIQKANNQQTTTTITTTASQADELHLVGTLAYANRTLRVLTDAPGVQLYTANWLDGTRDTKAPYGQWQGLCLETQTYPDGILDDDDNDDTDESEFAKGKCFILKPDGPNYSHRVEYQFEF